MEIQKFNDLILYFLVYRGKQKKKDDIERNRIVRKLAGNKDQQADTWVIQTYFSRRVGNNGFRKVRID